MNILIGGAQHLAPKSNLTATPRLNQNAAPALNPQETMTFSTPDSSGGFKQMDCLRDWATRNAKAKPGEHTPLTQEESMCMEMGPKIQEMRREQYLDAPAQKAKNQAIHARMRNLMMQ